MNCVQRLMEGCICGQHWCCQGLAKHSMLEARPWCGLQLAVPRLTTVLTSIQAALVLLWLHKMNTKHPQSRLCEIRLSLPVWVPAQGSMGVSMAAAAALEPQQPQEQRRPAEPAGRKEPLKSCNAAEATVASPNSLLFLPNKNKVMHSSSDLSLPLTSPSLAARPSSCNGGLAACPGVELNQPGVPCWVAIA